MKYDSITIGTNIFEQYGLNLESGMLGQLTQFKSGSAHLIFSEIVVEEVRKHLIKKAKDARDNLNSAVKGATKNKIVSKDCSEQLCEIFDSSSPLLKNIVEDRIKNFIDATGADIVPADSVAIKDLINSYFSQLPPFEEIGNKKNEFPDAIALLSLEKWAEANQQKILAISKDRGWSRFASNSEWIEVEEDLKSALVRFQGHAEAASTFMNELFASLDSGERPEMKQFIVDYVAEEVSESIVFGEAGSNLETEIVELEFYGLSFFYYGDGYDIDIIQIGNDSIVARIGLEISVIAIGEFPITDKYRSDVRIDVLEISEELDIDAAILVTFDGDFTKKEDEIDILEIELIEMTDHVYFSEIESGESDKY